MSLVNFIELPDLGDERGSLVSIESTKNIPFEVKRIYYIFNTQNKPRGFHAHKNLSQVLICVKGQCKVKLDNGKEKETILLDSPKRGLLIENLVWREMHDFSDDCVLLVLASDYYSESDYIRDYNNFLKAVDPQNIKLVANSIYIRLVEYSDAEFICQLRNNQNLNSYISNSPNDVEAQRKWIEEYKKRELQEKEYYFIICRNDNDLPIGTVRLYDFKPNRESFCWGSWILNDNKTASSALESALLVYQFGFEYLSFKQSHYDVRKGNDKVHSFHLKMGAVKVFEDDIDIHYIFKEEEYLANKIRYQRFYGK